jgi:DNA-binding MarR family transcriptional regulator
MVTGHNIPMSLRAAYLSMHRQTDACFAEHGVTANQFVLLALLAEEDAITQHELARRAFSDPNTIRAMLALLEKRGLVAREQHPHDGRARNVTITRKGRRAYKRLLQQSGPLRKRMLTLFRSDEVKMLVMFLSRISEAMTEIE